LAEIEEKRAYTIQKILNHKEKIRRDIWWDIKKLQTKKRELSGKKTKGGMTEKDKKEMKKKQEKNKEAIENVSKKLKKLEIPI